jgi:hypothetical protein
MTAIKICEDQKLNDPSVRISLGIILADARWANGDEAALASPRGKPTR